MSHRADQVAAAALRSGRTIAVAESLTCGNIASALGAGPDSSRWLYGAVVAYSPHVKHRVLGVPDVPVVSETAAKAMAAGVRSLLGADIAVAVTGVGGPDPQDGEPAGSVWLALDDGTSQWAQHELFDGDPDTVLRCTVDAAFDMLLKTLDSAAS